MPKTVSKKVLYNCHPLGYALRYHDGRTGKVKEFPFGKPVEGIKPAVVKSWKRRGVLSEEKPNG